MALLIAALLLVLMAVPARADAPPDPFEAVNRRVHEFNGFLRRTVLGPAAALYVDYTPQPVRAGLARALVNLGEPLTAVNALLAGEGADCRLGSLLGDFVHGRIPDDLRANVADGIRLHRAIDVFTDGHPVVTALRGRFVAPFRRYAGGTNSNENGALCPLM